MNLIRILQELQRYRANPNEIVYLKSIAHGKLWWIGCSGNVIETQDAQGNVIKFNQEGKIHLAGECILFPETGEPWEIYRKKMSDQYYDSLMRIGDICLGKVDETSNWVLVVYEGKLDGQYRARTGQDKTEWKYCIPYQANSGYLGRPSFPDWMIPDDELE